MAGRFILVAVTVGLLLPPATAAEYALVVGINKYENKNGDLRPLRHPENVARQIGEILGTNGYTVVEMSPSAADRLSKPALHPTRQNIEKQLDEILGTYDPKVRKSHGGKVQAGDVIFIWLGGHGLKFPGDKYNYFCPYDAMTRADQVDTLLTLERLIERLRATPAKARFLLVEACRTTTRAAAANGPKRVGPDPLTDDSGESSLDRTDGAHVLLSCRAGEQAAEMDKFNSGVFSHYVLEALRGQATSRRGAVTWDDVSRHVRENVSAAAAAVDTDQHPVDLTTKQEIPCPILTLPKPNPLDVTSLSPDLLTRKREIVSFQQIWATYSGKSIDEQITLNPQADADKQRILELTLIPAGKFTMGARRADGGGDDTSPHRVELTRPYFMAKLEVTQGQMRIMLPGVDKSEFSARGRETAAVKGEDTSILPADSVAYKVAESFCRQVTILLRQEPEWEGYECRLPTEAEWEFACRAGSSSQYHFGKSATIRNANLFFRGLAPPKRPLPAGEYAPNDFGLRDMHGNVAEWCSDWYAPYSGRDEVDPTGPRSSPNNSRVIRGGHFMSDPHEARTVARAGHDITDDPMNVHGFRVVIARKPIGR